MSMYGSFSEDSLLFVKGLERLENIFGDSFAAYDFGGASGAETEDKTDFSETQLTRREKKLALIRIAATKKELTDAGLKRLVRAILK